MKLDIGFDGPVQIRKVPLPELVSSGISILYLSDFHFNRYSRHLANRLNKLVDAVQPDILLLGGDYADTHPGLRHFEVFLTGIRGITTYAVAGNHDYFLGLARVRESLERSGVQWLEKKSTVLHLKDRTVAIDGNCFQNTQADYRILCLHKPVRVPLQATYHFVLAGHLHGSQFVFWETDKGLYPGRWFYRWNITEEDHSTGRYVVSRGLGDTLPLRVNCPREAILIEF